MELMFLCKGPSIGMIYYLIVCMVVSFGIGCYTLYRLFNSQLNNEITDGFWLKKLIYTFCFFATGILSAIVSLTALAAIGLAVDIFLGY